MDIANGGHGARAALLSMETKGGLGSTPALAGGYHYQMRRRSVIIGGLTGLLLAPEHAYTQQPSAKIPRVGIVTQAATDKNDPRFDAFRERLHDLGYVEGRNIILEFRF